MSEKKNVVVAGGLVIGVIASVLVFFGNPVNMGFCIACFLRDTAGALGLHDAKAVQYIRPEIIGIVMGSFVTAMVSKEFSPRGGSSPMTRFMLGFFVMIGCLMFLGCPFRMIIRLAGGDLNAILGLAGFAGGILTGVFFLNRGYTLKRTYKLTRLEGSVLPLIFFTFLAFLVIAPPFIHFSEAGPGASHAPVLISLAAGAAVGFIAQRTRLCMVGGIRDIVLFGDCKLIWGFMAILAAALASNLILSSVTGTAYFNLGFEGQPVAHNDGLWNALGMYLTGLGSVLLGGCPLRQLILSGEGNGDSAVTVLGLMTGAAFAHNFALASSGKGPTAGGEIAVVIGIAVVLAIAWINTFGRK